MVTLDCGEFYSIETNRKIFTPDESINEEDNKKVILTTDQDEPGYKSDSMTVDNSDEMFDAYLDITNSFLYQETCTALSDPSFL